MKVLAGSLNVEVHEYLHAGYLSAYPRSFDSMGSLDLVRGPAELIDIKSSLELKPANTAGESLGQDAVTQAPLVAIKPPDPAFAMGDGFLLAISFFFFAFLISVYYRRMRKKEQLGWRPWLLAVLPLMAALLGVMIFRAVPGYQAQDFNNLPPPWANAPIKEYRDPEAATRAILHALVVNALSGCSFKVTNLAAIQYEVAFPVPEEQYTPGMIYARQTYGFDGWGREFRFQLLSEGRYQIASAGADGVHGTPDDITFRTAARDFDNWEQLVSGIYVRRVHGDYLCFIHRVGHGKFEKAHATKSREITDSDQFDAFELAELTRFCPTDEAPPIVARLEEYRWAETSEARTSPLLFLRVTRDEDG